MKLNVGNSILVAIKGCRTTQAIKKKDLNVSAAYAELKKSVCHSLSNSKDRIFKNNHRGEIKLDEFVLK